MKTVELYRFFELPDNIKASIIEKNRYINVEFNDWFDDVKFDFENLLTDLGFYDFDLWFSAFVFAECEMTSLIGKWSYDLARPYKVDRYWRRFLTRLSKYKGATATINRCNIESDYQSMDFLKDLENLRLAICDAYYKCLESEYDYYISDDAVADTLYNCDWLLYTKTGLCIND